MLQKSAALNFVFGPISSFRSAFSDAQNGDHSTEESENDDIRPDNAERVIKISTETILKNVDKALACLGVRNAYETVFNLIRALFR